MPHPRNLQADLDDACSSDYHHKPFLIGCTACLAQEVGCPIADMTMAMDDSEEYHQWGYPDRVFEKYESGRALLEDLGDTEVRDRLRIKQLLHRGTASECAERLLLHERDSRTPYALLESVGGVSGRKLLVQRLLAVGLKAHGEAMELAQRLLQLREKTVKELSTSPQHERQMKAIAYALSRR